MQMDKRGDERRHGNLRRAVEHRAHQRLPHRHVAMRVLDLHRRIVHQDADGERQPAERHHVDGLAEQAEDRDRRQDRQRNRDADDQRAAPAAQEQQDHQARSAAPRSASRARRRRWPRARTATDRRTSTASGPAGPWP